ncbi:MAG: TerB N-terminal domain-containing protein [Deltaproteobacteria bacterium]|nr:TerB N-terminal domain-containing protein [Deltaproteobacteria bacterium]
MELFIALFLLYVAYRVAKALFFQKKPIKQIENLVYFEEDKPSGKPAKWYGWTQSITVQAYPIKDGLVYVGELLLDTSGYNNDACLINPKLKVSPADPWEAGDEISYWPAYASISPKCRGAYLKWLASGRSEPEANIGYVFLFFYGLERRLFLDGQREGISDEERLNIIEEVKRLLKIYGSNRSFRGYAANFLAMEWVLYQSDKPIPDYIDFEDRYCSEPFQVVLAQYVAQYKPIPVDIMLQWLILHPEFGLRTPARRCAKEFRSLFKTRYQQKFGDGLIVKPNKTPLKLEYHSASPSLKGDLKLKFPKLPNPFILTSPLKKISSLVEECTLELESYSRYLGRKGNEPQSLNALALLPQELFNQFPKLHQTKLELSELASEAPSLLDTGTLYKILGESVPVEINKKESKNLAEVMEKIGFGIAPDTRFHNIKINPEGHVVIFPRGHGVDFQPSREFCRISIILRLGAIVSQIDNDLSPAEEKTLQFLIKDNRELNSIEKDSLEAFLYWCLRTSQGTSDLKKKFLSMSLEEKIAISHILISVAHADGYIDPREIKQLEKLYSTLGLDKDQVTKDIHALATTATEPVVISHRDEEASFSIPKDLASTSGKKLSRGFSLNEELIKLRQEETRQVKGVLEEIFEGQSEEEAGSRLSSEKLVESTNPLSGLDQAHQNLLDRLVLQENWKRSSFYQICDELGLMVDGAMEVLNEWAFDHANAPLIDDGEPIYIDVNLAKEIIHDQ